MLDLPKVPNMRWYEGYEPKPKVLLSTLDDTRSGVAFQEIESPRFGSFDAAASAFSLGWTLDPLHVRADGSRTFRTIDRRPRLLLPGDSSHGEWQGVARTLILCVFDDLIENTLNRSLACFARPQFGDSHFGKLQHYLELIRADAGAGSPAGTAVAQALAVGVLDVVFPDDHRSRQLQQAKDPARFARMADYIDANLRQDLRLEEIETQAGVSIRHMSRIFKVTAGLAPHKYIVRRRLDRAVEMIRHDGIDLSEIAAAVGFSSHAHMTTAFRQIMKRLPSQFRNSQ